MTLTEFLLARIAEDEAVAQEVAWYLTGGAEIEIHLSRREGDEIRSKVMHPYRSARVLAECEAKRRIVNRARGWIEEPDVTATSIIANDLLGHVLECLALPYADHPEFREEWRA